MQEVKALTARQKEVLDFIRSFFQENEYAPSLKEVARFLKTENLSTAQYFIEELEKKGYLSKSSYKNRGINPKIVRNQIPLLGYIAAGEPIEPIENPESISIPDNIKMNSNYPHYALRIKGDSMIDMGILDKDVVIIKHQLTAQNNDVVVAITEKGATLKVFKQHQGKTYLEPRNKTFPNIYPESLEIRGVFVGLLRTS